MNHLIVYAHPLEDSFNHALLETAVNALQNNGHHVVVRDLNSLGFDPVLSRSDLQQLRAGTVPKEILEEQKQIKNAEVITLIYPLWWTGMPAVLKGYIDRVFSYGFAYQYTEEGTIEGLLSDKKGMMITTYGTPDAYYDASGMTQALKLTSDTGIFDFCGIDLQEHRFFGGISTSDDTARKEMLGTVKSIYAKY